MSEDVSPFLQMGLFSQMIPRRRGYKNAGLHQDQYVKSWATALTVDNPADKEYDQYQKDRQVVCEEIFRRHGYVKGPNCEMELNNHKGHTPKETPVC